MSTCDEWAVCRTVRDRDGNVSDINKIMRGSQQECVDTALRLSNSPSAMPGATYRAVQQHDVGVNPNATCRRCGWNAYDDGEPFE